MKNKHLQIFILFFVFIFLVGCNQTPKDMPDIGVPKEEINSRLRLYLHSIDEPGVKNNLDFLVEVEVKTSDRIQFPKDYGVRMFVRDHDQWIEIENKMQYPEDRPDTIILPVPGLAPPMA